MMEKNYTYVTMVLLLSVLFGLFQSSLGFIPGRIYSNHVTNKMIAPGRSYSLRTTRITSSLKRSALNFKGTETNTPFDIPLFFILIYPF